MALPLVRRIRLSEELQARAKIAFGWAMYYQQNALARMAGAAEDAIKFLDRTLEVATIDTWPTLWREASSTRKDMAQLLDGRGATSEDDEENGII